MRAKVSNETFERLKNGETKQIISFLPTDKSDCDCFGVVRNWIERLNNTKVEDVVSLKEKTGIINCPAMLGKKKFEIRCGVCGDLVAYVYASSEHLVDWCNLHYVSEPKLIVVKKKEGKKIIKTEFGEWHGCMAVNISPIDGKLGFECACGNDTRDFRLAHLTNDVVKAKMKENMIGRDLNQSNSKFILVEVK